MYEYFFLIVIGLLWMVFASVQDFRTKEIANWLTFSLIIFGLGYRAFFSLFTHTTHFFLFGLGGLLLFTSLAYVFYYCRVFAGGDAKLLIGVGTLLPFESLSDYLFMGLGFVFLLFAVGSAYSLFYTIFLVRMRKKDFLVEWKKEYASKRYLLLFSGLAAFIGMTFFLSFPILAFLWGLFVFILPLFYMYAKAVERACMIAYVPVDKLTEGDWLVKDIVVHGKAIRATVHGLNEQELAFLRKHGKKIWIRQGVPFAPAFLLAFTTALFVLI